MINIFFVCETGGDGTKRTLLEEMRERHQLQQRVEMLGAIDHDKVREVSHIPQFSPSTILLHPAKRLPRETPPN